MKNFSKEQRRMLLLITALIAAALAAAFGGSWTRGEAFVKKERGYVAVIRVEGEIYGGADAGGFLSREQGAASERVMREFREARLDENAKAVLLRINSPGGSASAVQEMTEELDKLKSSGKPVIVSMGDMCASAGYWLASRGDYIFASPGTMTGSIGVYMDYNNVEELMDKLGIRNEKIKSGAHKDILSYSRPMTEEERGLLQEMVDEIFADFVRTVADGRKMEEAKVREIADGRVLTGSQALEAGLIDAIGNYYDALDYAGNAAGFDEGEIPTRSYGEPRALSGFFSSEISEMGRTLARSVKEEFLKGALGEIRVK